MSTRNKEVCVLLLDVGPFMHPAMAFALRAASAFVLSKILNKPTHELAIVLYGTEGTSNPLQEEMAAENEPDQFTCITVLHPLSLPDQSFLTSLADVHKGTGRSDFVDALTVAVDCIYRAAQERPVLEGPGIKKRITLISNFLQPAAGEPDDPFLQAIADKMRDKDVLLELISVDVPEQDAQATEAKASNRKMLDVLTAEVRCKTRSVSRALDLIGALATREYAHTAYYSGPFTIGDMMTMRVKVCKKTSKEKLPTLNKYSDRSADADASHQIIRETEYRTASSEAAVAPEDKVKAYKYGRQVVPIASEEEQQLQYLPDKAFELLGFVKGDSIPPRHYFMKDTWIVAPEKGNEGAQTAMSALALAMTSSHQRAIVRFVPRAKGAVQMGILSPCLAPEGNTAMQQPDCLWLNILPFTEDVRVATFTSFESQSKKLPSSDQLAKMKSVVKAMHLPPGDDKLQASCDDVINPVIHRFHSFIASLVVDPSAQVPDTDPLLDYILKGEVTGAEAAEALKALPSAFPMKPGVALEKKSKHRRDATQEDKAGPEEAGPAQDADMAEAAAADVKSEEVKEEDLGEVVAAKEHLATLKGTADDFDDMD